ncbi:hypothetical protein G3I19_31875 [Streptomyces sp. SID10853]|uniref:hypothetical protein n=1 Tax=Streptomyces sp. SID10853 TaxID=2706028 RepID=UPI0013C198B3|nr:hypothetical protein [Streptomyces sp. SID10853]NDZ83043.1 hypothetical protein [Streptomyces sp. SID10853]
MTLSLVRLVFAASVVQALLRRYFPRIARLRLLTPQRQPELPALFAELQRIEADLAYRTRFFAGLNTALAERNAERMAELAALRTAVGHLRNLVGSGDGGPAA